MGIYDAMKLCKADVSTIFAWVLWHLWVLFLLAARCKGKRYCMPNACVMIHQPIGTAGGKTEIDTDRDNFMNPWEAKEYGLVDAVIDDGKPGLVAPIPDSTPPPKSRVWDFWKIEGSGKAKQNLPSELKISQNGLNGSSDKEKGSEDSEPSKEAQAPV